MSNHVIVITPTALNVPPNPGSQRAFYLFRELAKTMTLHCVTAEPLPNHQWRAFQERQETEPIFSSVFVGSPNHPHSPWSRIKTFLAGKPYWDFVYKDSALIRQVHDRVRQLAAEFKPVKFIGYSHHSIPFLPEEFFSHTLMDAVDAILRLVSQELDHRKPSEIKRKLVLHAAGWTERRAERRVFPALGAVALNSDVDVEYIKKNYPRANVVRVPDGCDVEYFLSEPDGDTRQDPNELVFVGAMHYLPNADAALYMARDVMPLIWQQNPDVRVTLIGPDPPDELRAYHDGNRINVTGRVDDIRPYLRRAAIVISPIRYGAGMKNKLQAGLCMSKPMVVSSKTCEGFEHVIPGRDLLVADTPDDFAAKVRQLLKDPETAQRMGQSGQQKILDHYSWTASGKHLRDALAQIPAI